MHGVAVHEQDSLREQVTGHPKRVAVVPLERLLVEDRAQPQAAALLELGQPLVDALRRVPGDDRGLLEARRAQVRQGRLEDRQPVAHLQQRLRQLGRQLPEPASPARCEYQPDHASPSSCSPEPSAPALPLRAARSAVRASRRSRFGCSQPAVLSPTYSAPSTTAATAAPTPRPPPAAPPPRPRRGGRAATRPAADPPPPPPRAAATPGARPAGAAAGRPCR